MLDARLELRQAEALVPPPMPWACSVLMHAWHGGALSGPFVHRSVYVTMYNT